MASKRTLLRAATLGSLAFSLACGAPSTPATTTTSQTQATSIAPSPPPLPDRLDDLTVLAPRQVSWAFGLPNLDGVRAQIDPALVQGAEGQAAEAMAQTLGLSREVALRVIAAYDGCFAFGSSGDVLDGAIAIRLRDPSVVETLVTAFGLQPKGPDRWSSSLAEVAWLAKAKVAIVARNPKRIDATLDRARGLGRDFAESPLHQARKPGDPWVSIDLAQVMPEKDPGTYEPGSKLLAWFDPADGLHVQHVEIGDKVPGVGAVIAPSALASVADLPAGPVIAYGLSIERAPGKGMATLVEELTRMLGPELSPALGPEMFEAQLSGLLGVDAPTLDRGLGDEIAVGVYLAPKPPAKAGGKVTKQPPEERGAMLGRVAMRDPAIAKRIVDTIGGVFKNEKGWKTRPGGFSFTKGKTAFDVEAREDEILAVGGLQSMVTKLKVEARAPAKRLGDDAGFAAARARSPREIHGLLFADFDGMDDVFDNVPNVGAPADVDLMLTAALKPNKDGIDASYLLTAQNPTKGIAAGVGVAAALAIYGVQTYLAESKAAEAKNTLGAISRSVVASYEREQPGGKHTICGAAPAVPQDVPRGQKHVPSDAPGKDFETGTDVAGWRCLRFTMTSPHYFRYEYRVGKGYKGPARGGPDPGPSGFEVSAEGDLDGDGKTSLFTITGKVDAKRQRVVVDPDIFIVDERE